MRTFVLSFDCLSATSLGCFGSADVQTEHFDTFASQSVCFDWCHSLGWSSQHHRRPLSATTGRDFIDSCLMQLRDAGKPAVQRTLQSQSDPDFTAEVVWTHVPDEQLLQHITAELITNRLNSIFEAEDGDLEKTITTPLLACAIEHSGSLERRTALRRLAESLSAGDDESGSAATAHIWPHITRVLREELVRCADEALAAWLSEVEPHARPDDLCCVLALHGDPLAARFTRANEHQPFAEEQAHVPLFFKVVGDAERERSASLVTIENAIQFVTSAPRTDVLDALDDWIIGLESQSALFSQSDSGSAVRTREWLRIVSDVSSDAATPDQTDEEPFEFLFAKPSDRWERLNVAAQHPDICTALVDVAGEPTEEGATD